MREHFSNSIWQVTRVIKRKLSEVAVSDYVIFGFNRFFVPSIVARYNKRAHHYLQVEVAARRRGLIAVPVDGETERISVAIAPYGKLDPIDATEEVLDEEYGGDEDSFVSVDCSVYKSGEYVRERNKSDRYQGEESKSRTAPEQHRSPSMYPLICSC